MRFHIVGTQEVLISHSGLVTELQRHTKDLVAQPENWMPWNYPLRQNVP